MKTFSSIGRIYFFVIFCLAMLSFFVLTGCTVDHHGMTLLCGGYLKDKVEYHPPGPRYQFSNEAAYLQEARSNQDRNR
ncbi:MAG: hypothetical protein LBC74_08945 [Planctomycetaceae bacterium]|jgi:hypothetical protein|nr:hypothetical protein [Planctomycetaceae bacterium]